MALSGKQQIEEILARGIEPPIIRDPGNGGAIDVSRPGLCEITTTGAETRTIADPTFRGQQIDLNMVVDGGDCVITSASPINQTGNTTITLNDVGDFVRLVGKYNATDGWEWEVIVNDGASLG